MKNCAKAFLEKVDWILIIVNHNNQVVPKKKGCAYYQIRVIGGVYLKEKVVFLRKIETF